MAHHAIGQLKELSYWVLCVIAESYERIHRSNLVGMGVLPLEYKEGDTAEKLDISGKENFTIIGIEDDLKPLKEVQVIVENKKGEKKTFNAIARLDSQIEIEYYRNGGILQYVLRQFLRNEVE